MRSGFGIKSYLEAFGRNGQEPDPKAAADPEL